MSLICQRSCECDIIQLFFHLLSALSSSSLLIYGKNAYLVYSCHVKVLWYIPTHVYFFFFIRCLFTFLLFCVWGCLWGIVLRRMDDSVENWKIMGQGWPNLGGICEIISKKLSRKKFIIKILKFFIKILKCFVKILKFYKLFDFFYQNFKTFIKIMNFFIKFMKF